MEKRGKISLSHPEISEINLLIRSLENHIKKFESAYKRKDFREFNSLKKNILQIQKRINSIAE